MPVQPPNPAASPPFSNSTSEDSGPTTGTTGSGSSFSLSHTASSSDHHHHQSNSASFPYSSNNHDALFPPPSSNFAGQTQQSSNTASLTDGVVNGINNSNTLTNGQFEHAFLQQDPFAYPSATSSSNRARTLSSGSSSNNSQHQQHHHHHQQNTGSLSANGIWADQPQQSSHQQRNSGAFDAFNGNGDASGQMQMGQNSPFNAPPPPAPSFQQNQQQQMPHHQQYQQANLRQQFNQGQQMNGGGSRTPQAAPTGPDTNSNNGADDIIPTGIVIKNIPFNFPSTSLLQIIEELTLAPPYAFNYHYDMSVFRGLAFANFHTPQETDACVAALNGFEIQGRKLRVEYKKVLQAGEKERIERDKAIKRMRSMQLDRERMIQQQQAHVHHLQQQIFGGGASHAHQQQQPLPPHMQQVPQHNQFHQQQQPSHLMHLNQQQQLPQHQMGMAPGHHHQHSNDDFEDYGRAVHPSNSMFNQPHQMGGMGMGMAGGGGGGGAFSPPMELGDSYASHQGTTTSGSGASTSSRTGSGTSMPTELDMNDPQTLELYSRVLLFKDDALRDELAFSKALSNIQRRIVHLIAQKLSLDHRSAGSGDERYVVVSKASSSNGNGNSHRSQQYSQQQPQQQRSLRTRASAYPMLNPDPYAPPQPSLLPEGMMNMQGFTNAMRKKSMPDLRHQQQHPLYSNLDYQQYPSSPARGGGSAGFHQQHSQPQSHSITPPLSANHSQQGGANITPRHSTHDLRAVAASASNRRSMYFNTAAPGEDNSIPPVPALPANLLQQQQQQQQSQLQHNGLPSNAMMNSNPTSASTNGSGSDRHSVIFGSGSVDLDNNLMPKGGGSPLTASTLSLDSKIVGSPVKGDPSSAAANGVVRQPRGPDNTSSWTRAAAIAASGGP